MSVRGIIFGKKVIFNDVAKTAASPSLRALARPKMGAEEGVKLENKILADGACMGARVKSRQKCSTLLSERV